MSTIYGTITTASPPPDSSPTFQPGMGTRRPWKQMLVSFSIPESFNSAVERLHTNAAYFLVNYAMVVLLMLFLSLLWRPVSLIVIAITIFAWLFLYFLRDAPIEIWGHALDDRLVLAALSVFTVVLLVLTRATAVLVALAVGIGAAVVHAVFRRTTNLDFDGDGGPAVRLRETASATYSAF